MLDPVYKDDLRERIVTRAKNEWPGFHPHPDRGFIHAGPVREGGATDQLIALVARIAIEEADKF